MTIATAQNSLIIPHTTFPALSLSPAPIAWPMSTVTPMVSPVTMVVTATISWLPVATAEMLAVEPNCPTTTRSTAPYSACKNRESMSGTEKRMREGRIFP